MTDSGVSMETRSNISNWMRSTIEELRKTVPDDKLGLDPFFLKKATSPDAFHAYEHAIVDYIEKTMPKGSTIIEPGCGLGSLGFYFAKAGYNYIGIEANEGIMNCLNLLCQNFLDKKPEFRYGLFPNALEISEFWDKEDLILVMTNLGASYVRQREGRFLNFVRTFDMFIMDCAHFGRIRRKKIEKEQFKPLILDGGCTMTDVLYDNGLYELCVFKTIRGERVVVEKE